MSKETVFHKAPAFIQNLMVSLYNILEYRKRYGKNYLKYKSLFHKNSNLSIKELNNIQKEKYSDFIHFVKRNSQFYNNLYKGIQQPEVIANISKLPILSKEIVRSNLKDIHTLSKNKAIISKTGGTTGKSLEVRFTEDSMQERFALLDNFREQFGYKLGKKTAWFSGKNLLNKRDLNKKRFWKTDYFYKVRYYSTFHIHQKYLKYYLENLIQYQPEYLVGFSSSIIEIARYGNRHNIQFPKGLIKAIFPTAETISPSIRKILSEYFHTEVYDQYATSEGAPFIFECKNHNLHLELQSGVFEVLDENNQPTKSGKLVITSFTTYGTPLIRFDIGDRITLSDKNCRCGNNNPLVNRIDGRIDDYIYAPEIGKINLGNISNTLKDVHGVIKFQVIQEALNTLEIKLIIDKATYTKKDKNKFISNFRDRIGNALTIKLIYVENIPLEKSGKFRLIKNSIKHLV